MKVQFPSLRFEEMTLHPKPEEKKYLHPFKFEEINIPPICLY